MKKLASTLLFGSAVAVATVETSEAADNTLVDLRTYVHDLVVSKPYATANNFTGQVVYPASDKELSGVCKMNKSAAGRIEVADRYLKAHGFPEWKLMAWDCYRPAAAQTLLWNSYGCDSNPSKCGGYIAAPGRSKHNSGYAIDLTLADGNGRALEMPTGYDNFSRAAHPSTFTFGNNMSENHWYTLNEAMTAAGCKGNPSEWWHYDC